ncbi:MAG: Ktr system potassium uptake protein B [Pelotomaculum sp. PtaB.Bin104]|nr:MAG: Ktr system potassium uptake protein B [Pelotomaculum sp. PtaB.Bin104]
MFSGERRLDPSQILVIGFGIVILIGSFLLSTPWAVKEGSINWLTALFTATSAVCVTGLVVVDTQTHWTLFGQVIILLLIQIGGLGIMSFATFFFLLLGKKINLRQRIIMQQAINKHSVEGIVNIFRYLLFFSFTIEAIGTILLAIHWTSLMGIKKALWFGLFHSVSAFNNAGFDLFGNFRSLTGFSTDLITNFIISSLIILGGLGFVVVHEIYSLKKVAKLSLHAKVTLISTAILIITGTILILSCEYNHALSEYTWSGKLVASYFQAVTPRTAGFNTVDLGGLLIPTQLLIMVLMFIGGSPGSTAGGIKTTTFTLLWLAIYSLLKGKKDTEIYGRRIRYEDVLRALSIALLSVFFIIFITFLILLTHKTDMLKAMFEVISALGTVGLTLGLTTDLNSLGRVLIIITMFVGRLGPLTIGYALAYQKKQPDLRYPEGKIMLG